MKKCEDCEHKGKEKSCPKCGGKMKAMGFSEMIKAGKK